MSILYAAVVTAAAVLYYRVPRRTRWIVLSGAGFIVCCLLLTGGAGAADAGMTDPREGSGTYVWLRLLPLILLVLTCAVSWLGGLLMDRLRRDGYTPGLRRVLLILLAVLCAGPVLYDRLGGMIFTSILHSGTFRGLAGTRLSVPGITAAPLLIASAQGISYMAETESGRIRAEANPLKYLAYACFLPTAAVGPLTRYWELRKGLNEGNPYDRSRIIGGLQLILWGLFLKLVIADRAAIGAGTVYAHARSYMGFYFLIAGVLYTLQIYTSLLAAVSVAAGIGGLFGFSLFTGFLHPLRAASTGEYWERFNGTVTGWLYDYIYRPLSGAGTSEDGAASLPRYALSVCAAALPGAFWYGTGFRAVFLGLFVGLCILCGELTLPWKEAVCRVLRLPAGTYARRLVGRMGTFLLTVILWTLLGAPSLRTGLSMLVSVVRDPNPWIFFDGGLLQTGLSWGDWNVLIAGTALLLFVEYQQRRICIRSWVRDQHALVRWGLSAGLLLTVFLFGVYGGAA